MAKVVLQVENMHCGACIRRVTQLVNGLPDTHAQAVQLGSASVVTEASPELLLTAMQGAGFPARIISTNP